MIAGRINAHIVSRLGAELIFRRALLASAVIGLVLFAMAAGAGAASGVWRCIDGCGDTVLIWRNNHPQAPVLSITRVGFDYLPNGESR